MRSMGLCDKTYFEGIYRNYSDELYRFLVYKLGNPTMAEDVTQNVFLNLWKNCAKYSDVNIKSLLYTMGKNDSLNVLRKDENKRKFVAQAEGSKQVHSPEFEMETKEFQVRINQVLGLMKPLERQAFLLSRIEKKTYKEIAEIMEVSVKTIEKRIHNALVLIRSEIVEAKKYV